MACSPLIGIQTLLNNDLVKEESVEKLTNVQFRYHKNKVEGVIKTVSGFMYTLDAWIRRTRVLGWLTWIGIL